VTKVVTRFTLFTYNEVDRAELNRHRMPSQTSSLELLAVSFIFPPTATARSVQVARLLKHLRASTTVVCADDEGAPRDPTIEPNAQARLRDCLRVPFGMKGWRKQAGRIASRFELPVWNRIPDEYSSWKAPALNAIRQHVSNNHYCPDLIASFAQPMSDHLIGLELKKLHGVPWVAHFSDPWTDNLFHHYDSLTKRINLSLERKVMEFADRLIFTSPETVELVMAKYPAHWKTKTRILPHSFDMSPHSSRPREDTAQITIRHTGEFYGPRTPKPLIRTLRSILSDNARALEGVSFELIGVVNPPTLVDSGIENLPPGLINIKPPVSYQESGSLSAAADGLLTIDAPAARSVFLPSKLIEYVGAGRPILGLTPPGAAANLIRELGGWVADPADDDAMKQTVTDFLSYLKKPGQPEIWGKAEVRRQYEAPVVAEKFEMILRNLLT
jgi:glycosyltransferase involved in cell wall biosynthesis